MAKETEKNDSEHLDCTWHEKVKNIRASAKRCKKNNTGALPESPESAGAVETPQDSELFADTVNEDLSAQQAFVGNFADTTNEELSAQQVFAGNFADTVNEELSAQQIFVGNEDFYRSLEDSQTAGSPRSSNTVKIPIVPAEYKRFSSVQKSFAAAIVIIAAVLLYGTLKSPSAPTDQMVSTAHQIPESKPPVTEAVHITPQQAKVPEPISDSTEPLSLEIAQTFYLNEDYDQALDVYEKLHKRLPAGTKENLMKDFLQLQQAFCMEKTADNTSANQLFRKLLKSSSPAVRVVAYYHCSLFDMQKKQYLNARTKAYQAIALIDAIDFDKDWSLSLKRDCYFLAAEALTKKVLSLCDADKDLPEDLWGNPGVANELFTKLNETQLRIFLDSGSQRLSQAILGPQIQRFDRQGRLTRYDVTCNGAPVEELLTRFAANCTTDLHWDLDTEEKGIRQRRLYLYLPSATTQQLVTAAAGCTGLVSQVDEKGVINISNPARYSYVSEHISFLSEEAVSLWQKFLIRFPADTRLANIHLAMGLLHTSNGRATESIAEYKLVANRFPHSSLAPFALLNSSKIKKSLHDYSGEREDLKQLVEQFPDAQITGAAYLYLAETTAKAGLNTEAARLYRKVYNLSLSLGSQSTAALGAGRCSYNIGDSKSAAKWLIRYIGLARNSKNENLYSAYFLLGKTYLALENPEAACNAFQYAIQGGASRLAKEEYIETISALVKAYMQQGQFVRSLDMLEGLDSVALSPKESIEVLLLKSRTLRAIGLVDKAIAMLGDRADYVSNPQLKAEIYFELSECYSKKGDLDIAHKKLTEVLILTESGPLAHKIALRLAEISLQLSQNSQTISVCSQLLDLQPPEQIKRRALELMAKAHNQQKNYDRAALALLGQWK